MYCGCNPIALSSQTQISDALTRLMAQKPYASITVSELCRESGVSRQTFYSLFSSMENVVAFTLREKVCALPREPEAASSLEQFCRCYSRYICANRDYLKLLVESSAAHLLYDSICESLLCCGERAPEPERRYAAHFLAGGLTGVVRQYCASEPPADADTLEALLRDLLRGAYFRPV